MSFALAYVCVCVCVGGGGGGGGGGAPFKLEIGREERDLERNRISRYKSEGWLFWVDLMDF